MGDVNQSSDSYWDKNLETDHTQQTERRNFYIAVGDKMFYIDPVEMSQKSPFFALLTSKQFAEGIRGGGRLHDKEDDIACLLQSTCPTVYDIYPRTIRVQSIPALARLADKYNLKDLQISCEYFAIRANFRKYGNNVLVKLLQTTILYNYDSKLQENLIKELMNRSSFLSESADCKMTRDICNIIVKYSLEHDGKGTPWGVCQTCGQQKIVDQRRPTTYSLWECKRCGTIYCLECRRIPCWIAVKKRLRSAFERYQMEELRQEVELQVTQQLISTQPQNS